MRIKGLNYDTGFSRSGAPISRTSLDPAQVRREMEIITRDLHCNAVRISGSDPSRIALAAESALAVGMEAWFAPFPCDMTPDELHVYFAEAAERAEALRRHSGRVVFVLGCEMSLFDSGFVPGATYLERIQMMNPQALADLAIAPEDLVRQFNDFLGQAVAVVRGRFGGQITYASGPWEMVDWTPFDLVGVDLYRDASNKESYREQVRGYFAHGRPVVITEFGCCTYRGAADRGAMGWAIVDRGAEPPRLNVEAVRDEQEQADYLTEVLRVLDSEGVDGAFWFTFASYSYPYSADPRHDLDRAAFGLVRALDGEVSAQGSAYPGMPWEPKRAFYALGNYFVRAN